MLFPSAWSRREPWAAGPAPTRRLRCERSRQLRLAPSIAANATPSAPPALPAAAPTPAMALWERTRWRAHTGLRLVRQIVGLSRKVLVKRKWHGVGCGRQQSGTAPRGEGNTQNSPKRAAAIDYIHLLTPFFVFGYAFLFRSPSSSGRSRKFFEKDR
jgi:hypothetical protein